MAKNLSNENESRYLSLTTDEIYDEISTDGKLDALSPPVCAYHIKRLVFMGQSFDDISSRIGKPVDWVRGCAEFASSTSASDFHLNKKNMKILERATKEELAEALESVLVS